MPLLLFSQKIMIFDDKNKIFRFLMVGIVFFLCFPTNRSISVDDNFMCINEEGIVDDLPETIQCVNINTNTHPKGLPPQRIQSMSCNIIPEWQYCLAGYYAINNHMNVTWNPSWGDKKYYLVLAQIVYSSDWLPNPLPYPLFLKDVNVKFSSDITRKNDISIGQANFGLYLCNYPALKSGDIFPLYGTLYYLEKEHRVRKLKKEQISQEIIKRKKSFCIPLDPLGTHQITENTRITFLPKMKLTVIDIQENNNSYFAKIGIPNNIFYSQNGELYANEFPGIPLIHFSEEHFGKSALQMTIREVQKGEIIHGNDGYGYRVISIVPPDPIPCRKIGEQTENIKGRIIGWVELDPTPIPLNEKSNSMEKIP
jgi:hypothetical protein